MKHPVVAVICILLIAIPVVAAGHGESPDSNEVEEPESESHDKQDTEQEREVDVDVVNDRVRIESSFETETAETEKEDEFKLDFSVQMDPRIELSSESERETTTDETENESEYKVRFRSLVEFADENNNDAYDEGEAVSTYDLSQATYRPVSHITQTNDGNTVHVIEATTTDDIFTIRLYAVGDITNINGEQVSPTEVKIDLEMHDFQFASNDSKLALRTETSSEAEQKVKHGRTGGETVVRSTGDADSMFFSWKNQAQVDGETTPVRSTQVESDGDEQEFFLVYDQGSSIIHDPKIGVGTSSNGIGGFLNQLVSFFSNLFSIF